MNRERTAASWLALIRSERRDGIQHHACGAIGIDGERVLPLRPHAVVVPAIHAGGIRRAIEVIGQRIVVAAEIVKPALPERIEHKGARVEIAMVSAHLAAFGADEGRTAIGPLATHRHHFLRLEGRACITMKGHVRRGAIVRHGDASVIIPPQRTQRTAAARVLPAIVGRDAVAPCHPLKLRPASAAASACIGVVKNDIRGAERVHRSVARLGDMLRVADAEITAQHPFQTGQHPHAILRRVTPVARAFIPRAVVGGEMLPARACGVDGAIEDVLHQRLGFRADDQGTHAEATSADLIPVVAIALRPACVRRELREARRETFVDDRRADRRAPRGVPVVVKPVVTDGAGVRHLRGVKEVAGVPVWEERVVRHGV